MKVCIKMEKSIITFCDIEIEKQTFYQHKKPISINNIDIYIKWKYLMEFLQVKKGLIF